jgi:geranylgeranyl reductase family protein
MMVWKRKFDVIVIGAGPGGSAAAYLLAAAGQQVALIDKAKFPRDKLCGGFLSQRTEKTYKSIFQNGWENCYEFTSSDIGFYYKNQKLRELRRYRSNYFTRRPKFDTHMAGLAQAKGALLLDGTGVESLDTNSGRVSLANGDEVRGDFIIGADGVNSIVARTMDLSIKKKNLAAGLEIELPRQGRLEHLERPEIYFGVVRWGYGWIIPKSDTLTIGIAGLARANRNFSESFYAFLKQVCGRIPDIKWKGHPIPFGNSLLKPGRKNNLLVGDAAGLADPLTGEGIAFALKSGSYAAQAVLKAMDDGKPERAIDYYQTNYNEIVRLFSQARKMRYLVFPALSEKLFIRVLLRSENVTRRFMDLLADEIDYAAYAQFLAQKIGRYFIRLGRNS